MRRLALVVLVLLVSACATYPPPKPPKIEGNRYQNYRHGLALELPGEPWKPTEKLPAWFGRWVVAAGFRTGKIQLVLFNNQTNAFIVVACSRFSYPVKFGPRYEDYAEVLEIMRKESLKSDQITRFKYDLWAPSTYCTGWRIEVDFETEVQRIRIIRMGKNYPLHDDAHIIDLLLWSDRLTVNLNFVVLEKMFKSIEWGEFFTEPTAE